MSAPPPPATIPPDCEEVRPAIWKYVFVIPTVIVAIITMFVVTMGFNDCPHQEPHRKCLKILKGLERFSFQPMSENPLLGPSSETLLKYGALQSEKTTHGEPWRLLSGSWLHAGVFHLLSNIFGLVFLGWRLEKEFGGLYIGVLYLLSGLGGAILSALFLQRQVSVGASGAVFGLLGATTSELLVNWSSYRQRGRALMNLAFMIIVNLIFGLMPFVDNFAHIGGLVSGFFLGFVLLVRPAWSPYGVDIDYDEEDGKNRSSAGKNFVRWVAFAVILGLLAGGLLMLFTGFDLKGKCKWCKYMSCVPTPAWKCPDAR